MVTHATPVATKTLYVSSPFSYLHAQVNDLLLVLDRCFHPCAFFLTLLTHTLFSEINLTLQQET